MDHRRKQYYETYTDQSWGSIESHQILFNISKLGIPQTIDTIKHLYADSLLSDLTKTNT